MSGGTIKPEDRPGWRPVKRNCWTCGWDYADGRCAVIDQKRDGWEKCSPWPDGPIKHYPPTDADLCPGWKPKPGADSATDSATATVKDSLTVGAGWRGHLPLCRGPGGIQARRLRALVRGRMA